MSNQKVGVYLEIKNSKENSLSIPLPKGTMRVYKKDMSTAASSSSARMPSTTRRRTRRSRVKLGDAFDVVGEQKGERTGGKLASDHFKIAGLRK